MARWGHATEAHQSSRCRRTISHLARNSGKIASQVGSVPEAEAREMARTGGLFLRVIALLDRAGVGDVDEVRLVPVRFRRIVPREGHDGSLVYFRREDRHMLSLISARCMGTVGPCDPGASPRGAVALLDRAGWTMWTRSGSS